MQSSPSVKENSVIPNPPAANVKYLSAKEKARLELEAKLAEFKSRGKKITELPAGYTKYPDGKLPPVKNKKAQETPAEKIAEVNSLIAEEKQKRNKAAKAKIKSISSKPPKNVLPPEEVERRKQISQLKREAAAKGLKEFMGPCGKHGISKYLIYSDCIKCLSCQDERNKIYQTPHDPEQINNRNRKRIIRERREAAEAKGETTFMGICSVHKETPYAIQKSGASRCMECCAERQRNERHKEKTPEQLADLARKKKNKELFDEALANGLLDFNAECMHCGPTIFRVKTLKRGTPEERHYHFCLSCAVKRDAKLAESKAA